MIPLFFFPQDKSRNAWGGARPVHSFPSMQNGLYACPGGCGRWRQMEGSWKLPTGRYTYQSLTPQVRTHASFTLCYSLHGAA